MPDFVQQPKEGVEKVQMDAGPSHQDIPSNEETAADLMQTLNIPVSTGTSQQ